MSAIPTFTGVVSTDGRLMLDARGVFRGYLSKLANKPIELIIRVKRKQRSLNQNAWYWGCILPAIAEHCGYQPHEHEALHDELVRMHVGLKPEPNPLKLRITTADMTTADFADYCEHVRIWAATDLGVVIADPDKAVAA